MTLAAPQVDDASPPRDPSAAAAVFAVRPFREGDLAFVTDSWLRSAWDVESRALKDKGVSRRLRELAGTAWYALNRPMVSRLLAGGVAVVVAVSREDEDHIAGWLAVSDASPVYLYVKSAYRGWGVAKLLAETAGVELSR